MTRMYVNEQINSRIEKIGGTKPSGEAREVTMYETFLDPTIRRAAWVAVCLSAFQQFCGINVIMFYSSVIFSGLGFSANTATVIIQTFNFLATLSAVPVINKFGRKSMLLITYSICVVFLLATAFSNKYDK